MLEILKKRRSVRKFTDKAISKEDIETILKAGLLSPTGMGNKHVEFIVIEDKASIENLVNFKAHSTRPFKTARLAIAILGNLDIAKTWIEDTALSAIYMQLQIEELGLGSTWIHLDERQTPDGRNSNLALREYLGYPENRKVLCVLAIGYKDEEIAPYTEADCDMTKVHYEKY